ncbi:MAG TPA: RDD family protein [bacterium]|nr:RDD family protein [bacterium]
MDWYYARDKEPVGPLGELEFQSLVSGGTVNFETLVWRPGMKQWQRYGELVAAPATMPRGAAGLYQTCAECGRMFPLEDMVRYGAHFVCAECKPVFFQRLREGVPIRGVFAYGGFWIRAAAKFLDGIILWVANMGVQMVFGLALGFAPGMGPQLKPGEGPSMFFVYMALMFLAQLAVPAGYTTWFLGKYEATPGKMALGLKVIRPDGERITYLRAFARHFAEMLSGIILGIGYIMAGFDEEKRSLHDRICDTRVVRK